VQRVKSESAGQETRGGAEARVGASCPSPAADQPRFFSCSTSVTSASVAVNGVQLHYQRTGEGEHAVLLLPGMLGLRFSLFGGCSRECGWAPAQGRPLCRASARCGETDFGPQIKKLNKELFTVVAWDPRGYGRSRPPDRDFPRDFFERDAKDAVDLMKALRFPKASLLGWSDGGITALIAAARFPAYVSKMVVWGANAYVTDEDQRIYEGRPGRSRLLCGTDAETRGRPPQTGNPPSPAAPAVGGLRDSGALLRGAESASLRPSCAAKGGEELRESAGESDADRPCPFCLPGIRDVSKWSEKTRKPLEALYGFDYLARTCEQWVDGIGQFRHLPEGNICRHLLPLVQCPTLVVHGEKDPLVPRFHADFIHKHVRGSR
ncbi:Valacyclovir hydrolase, partial [Galemys pyrenaicus]